MSGNLVLLVEDELLIALHIEMRLQDEGYIVHHAMNGHDAWSLLSANMLELKGLVTDIRCGAGPDGWEIARQARALLPDLPVIYVSGDAAGDHPRLGVPDSVMIAKPFHVERVLEAVDMLLMPQNMLR